MYTQYRYPTVHVNYEMVQSSSVSKIGYSKHSVTSQTSHDEHDLESAYATSFPWKLHQLLSVEDNHTAVNWLSHGKAFRVEDPQRFSNEIVPHYFKRKSYLLNFIIKCL